MCVESSLRELRRAGELREKRRAELRTDVRRAGRLREARRAELRIDARRAGRAKRRIDVCRVKLRELRRAGELREERRAELRTDVRRAGRLREARRAELRIDARRAGRAKRRIDVCRVKLRELRRAGELREERRAELREVRRPELSKVRRAELRIDVRRAELREVRRAKRRWFEGIWESGNEASCTHDRSRKSSLPREFWCCLISSAYFAKSAPLIFVGACRPLPTSRCPGSPLWLQHPARREPDSEREAVTHQQVLSGSMPQICVRPALEYSVLPIWNDSSSSLQDSLSAREPIPRSV